MRRPGTRKVALGLTTALLAVCGIPAQAQVSKSSTRRPVLAVLPVEVSWANANQAQPGDLDLVKGATELFRTVLASNGVYALTVDTAIAQDLQSVRDSGEACDADACAVEIGKTVGADRVLVTLVSKFSNLVWVVAGRMLDVASGEVVHTEALEVKGKPNEMIPLGLRSLARRMSHAQAATQ